MEGGLNDYPVPSVENVISALKHADLDERKWREIGAYLIVPDIKLDAFEQKYSTDSQRLRAVIYYWYLRDPYASWRRLISRLDWMNQHEVADKIRENAEKLTDSTLQSTCVLVSIDTIEVAKNEDSIEYCGRLENCLELSYSKCKQLRQQYKDDDDYRKKLIEYWLNYSPYASWSGLARRLLYYDEKEALEKVKKHLSSKTDSDLTPNNLSKVLVKVENLADMIYYLNMPTLTSSRGSRDECLQYLKQYPDIHPSPSWQDVANALYRAKINDSILDVVRRDYLQGSHESRRLLNEAMKNGKIKSSFTKILLHDCSKRGKSSFVNLILDIDSAQDDVVSHAAHPITAYEVDPLVSSNNKWKKIDKYQILARCEGAKLETVDSDGNAEDTKLQVKSKNQPLIHTAEQSSISDCLLDTAEPPKRKKMRLDEQEEVTSTCDTVMDHESAKSNINVVRRIKFIDSCGHPLFHQVLPGFLHHANLFISVFELSEKLSSKPMINFEYHDQNGKNLRTTFESAQTYQQLLEHCLRTLDSHKGKHSKIMIIGTHNDHNMYTNEILEANEKLRKIISTRYRDMVVYNGDDTFMFPVNTENPKEQEICQIQKIILDECKTKPIEIPLQYFDLLEEVRKEKARTVLSKSEFKRFAAARLQDLHFDEHKLDGALQFLHDISEVFYFPEILPNVVFTNPQVILDKIIELVETIHLCRNKKLATNYPDFKDHALFSTEFLSHDRFQKHYVTDVFTEVELVKVLEEMQLIADFGNSKYFMPSLLNVLEEDKISKYRVDHDSPAAPLALDFPGPQLGIYCSLTCFLVSPDNQNPEPWEIKKTPESLTPSCLYRNCIQFTIKKRAVDIVLIDTFTHFEVHVKLPVEAPKLHPKTCQYIRKAILDGMKKATLNLCYNNSMPSLVFVCPCDKGNPHVAYATEGYLLCSTYEYRKELSRNQHIWELDPEGKYKDHSISPTFMDILSFPLPDGTKVNLPREIGTKYLEFGVHLLEDRNGALIGALEKELCKNSEDINRRIFSEWLSRGGSWSTLVSVLEGIGLNSLAKSIRDVKLV